MASSFGSPRVLLTRSIGIAALLAAAAMGGVSASMASASRTIRVRRETIPEFSVAPNFYWNSQRRAGRGWSNAQQKRIAKKRRNVIRHRKACRG